MKGERNVRIKQIVMVLREGGYFTPKDLSDRLNLSERTVDSALKTGVFIGFIKKHNTKKGHYAWIDYSEDKPLIKKAIEKHLENHPQLRDGKRHLSNVDVDAIIDASALEAGKPKKDIEEATRKVVKKYFEKRG